MLAFAASDLMLGLEPLDFTMLVVYMAGITSLGLWMGKRIQSQADYFVGGRRFGKLFSIFTSFGAGTHSDQAVSVVAKTYTAGMSGIWYQWLWLFVTPFYWFIGPVFRRCRAMTTGDYFEARYSRGLATLYVVVGLLNMAVTIGVLLKGSGAIMEATTGGAVHERGAIALVVVVLLAYGVLGGFAAAVVTDFVQGLLTILFSFILLPFALSKLGWFSGLHRAIPDPDMWSLVAPGDISLYYIIAIVINALVGIVAQPHVMPIFNAVKSEHEARVGGVYGSMMKRVCTVAWVLLGMCAIAMYPGLTQKAHIDQMFGRMAHDLLPQVMPGLIGIFLAALLASIMAACDAFMVTCAGLFTQNIYRPFIARGRSAGHYIWIGRATAVVTVGVGVLIAFKLESVIQGLELFWMISAMMGIPFWIGLVWRGATSAAAWASTLGAFGVVALTTRKWFIAWAAEHANWMVAVLPDKTQQIHLPTQMVMYLTVGLVLMIVVSLFTKRVGREKLDRFYGVLRTPVTPNEHIEEPFQLPAGMAPGPQRKLIDHPDWEWQRPTGSGYSGFVIAWAQVFALIIGVYFLVRIGA